MHASLLLLLLTSLSLVGHQQLYPDKAPKAVENFLVLCTGEKGTSKASKKPLHFKGSRFHRIVEDFVCQGSELSDA